VAYIPLPVVAGYLGYLGYFCIAAALAQVTGLPISSPVSMFLIFSHPESWPNIAALLACCAAIQITVNRCASRVPPCASAAGRAPARACMHRRGACMHRRGHMRRNAHAPTPSRPAFLCMCPRLCMHVPTSVHAPQLQSGRLNRPVLTVTIASTLQYQPTVAVEVRTSLAFRTNPNKPPLTLHQSQ
jgi:hypothetical protein